MNLECVTHRGQNEVRFKALQCLLALTHNWTLPYTAVTTNASRRHTILTPTRLATIYGMGGNAREGSVSWQHTGASQINDTTCILSTRACLLEYPECRLCRSPPPEGWKAWMVFAAKRNRMEENLELGESPDFRHRLRSTFPRHTKTIWHHIFIYLFIRHEHSDALHRQCHINKY